MIGNEIKSPKFVEKWRKTTSDFTRKRKLAASFWEAQEIVDAERNAADRNKYEYKVNTTQAASVLRDYLILAIIADTPRKRKQLLKKMHTIIANSVILVRPNRFVPRKSNNRKAKFHHNRKPNL